MKNKLKKSELKNLKLAVGKHSKPEDGVCVMEAVALAAGELFTDYPICVDRGISRMAQRLNDRMPADLRDKLLKPLIFKMIGTAGSRELSIKRAFLAADYAVRVFTPLALDALNYKEQAAKLRSLSPLTDRATAEVGRATCRDAADAADAAVAYAAYAADAADAAVAYAADAAYAAADAKTKIWELAVKMLVALIEAK